MASPRGDVENPPGVGYLSRSRTSAPLRFALACAALLLVAPACSRNARADPPAPATRTSPAPTPATTTSPVPAGKVTRYEVRGTSIAVGADGNVWVAQGSRIAKVSQAGEILARYWIGSGADLTSGPDGRIWFGMGGQRIGAITRSGHVTTYPVPKGCHRPTAGPRQTIWMPCEKSAGSLDIASGHVSFFKLPHRSDTAFTLGSDGNMWYGDYARGNYHIAKITPDGVTVTEYKMGDDCTHGLEDVTTGPG